jgi:hypothetical protein
MLQLEDQIRRLKEKRAYAQLLKSCSTLIEALRPTLWVSVEANQTLYSKCFTVLSTQPHAFIVVSIGNQTASLSGITAVRSTTQFGITGQTPDTANEYRSWVINRPVTKTPAQSGVESNKELVDEFSERIFYGKVIL